MAVNDIYQETIVYKIGLVAIANVMYTKIVDDPGPDADDDAVAAAFINDVVAQLAITQTAQVEYECLLQRKVDPVTAPSHVYPIALNGQQPGDCLPANQAIIIRHQSLPAQRPNNGRIFQSGTPEAWVEKGRLKQADVSEFDGFIASITQPYVESGVTYQVQHFSPTNSTYVAIDTASANPRTTKLRNRTQKLCSVS